MMYRPLTLLFPMTWMKRGRAHDSLMGKYQYQSLTVTCSQFIMSTEM